MSSNREIVRHSAIYALGQFVARLSSFLLLPVYTSYLTPADYGVIAIVDLTMAVLGTIVGIGLVEAVSRFHFDGNDESARDAVWWTGQTFVVAASSLCVLAAWLRARFLSLLSLEAPSRMARSISH